MAVRTRRRFIERPGTGPASEWLRVGKIVHDQREDKPGKITAIKGRVVSLETPGGMKWDATTNSVMPPTDYDYRRMRSLVRLREAGQRRAA